MAGGAGGGGGGDIVKEYVSGFAAGIAIVVTGHPFDTVKVRLQAHNTKGQEKLYKNAWHCATEILSKEGVKGFYRGASSSFIGMAFESSLVFGIYSQMRQLLQKGRQVENSRPELNVIVPSAACGGAAITFILCPTELVKCRMQVQGLGVANLGYVRYNGPLDCALSTLRTEGIKGLFRGGISTLLRESIGNAVFFSTYEISRHYIRQQLHSSMSTTSQRWKLLTDVGIGIFTGGLAGTAFWCVVLPLDVAKTIIQTTPREKVISRNPVHSLALIYRKVGLRGCYAGLGPTLLRAFPANAAAIVTWEFVAKFLGIPRAQCSF